MATIQYGVIVTGARGSVGGVTFSKGGQMEVMKRKPRSARPMLASQQLSKQKLSQFSTTWRGLASGDRDDWNAYAATASFTNSLGQTYFLTGFQMFVRNSMALALRGLGQVASVPTAGGKSTLPDLTFDYNSTNLRLFDSDPVTVSGQVVWGVIWYPVAQSVNAPRGRTWGTFKYEADSLPLVIAASYGAGLASGVAYRAWVEVRYSDISNRVGDPFLYPVDFTA